MVNKHEILTFYIVIAFTAYLPHLRAVKLIWKEHASVLLQVWSVTGVEILLLTERIATKMTNMHQLQMLYALLLFAKTITRFGMKGIQN